MSTINLKKAPKYPEQAAEIGGILKKTGLSLEEAARRVIVEPDTMRKIAKGYQPASDRLMALIRTLSAPSQPLENRGDIMRDVQITVPRYVPVLTLAQAGNVLVAWENIPMHFSEKVACDLADPRAFAIRVQGNSMEPHFHEGDRLIVSPAQEVANGEIVVARFTNGDTVLKLYHESKQGREVQLASFNPIYPPKTYQRSEFEAIVVVVQRVQDVRMDRLRWQL